MSWKDVEMGSFLKARTERFKPNEKTISGLKRIEKIDFSGNIFLSDKASKTDMILVKNGDLIISGINVEKGAMSVYQGDEDIIATIHYSAYEFDERKIDIDFLKLFLKSQSFTDALKEQVPGGIKTEIKPKHILPLKVYIPTDIKEQRVIVELLTFKNKKINSISKEQNKQLDILHQLRQSFLREAMQGKLTEDWRKDNPDVEPASELLARIKAEKEQLIKEKRIKRGNTTGQTRSISKIYKVPYTWTYCKADDIFFVTKLAGFEYTKYVKLNESGEIPVIRAQNVRPLKIDKKNLLFIDNETSQLLSRCSLTQKCLLITFIGAGIGDVATFEETTRWHLAPNVAKMEPFEGTSSKLDLKYLNYYLMSEQGQKEVFKHIKATAQPSLSMATIRDIDLLIPPVEEQKIIVSKLDILIQYCEQIEEHIITSQQQNDLLLQQVLREGLGG